MRPEGRDAGYVWDMLDAARTIQDFTAGVTLEAYLSDGKLQLAVERAIEIIGEAASICQFRICSRWTPAGATEVEI